MLLRGEKVLADDTTGKVVLSVFDLQFAAVKSSEFKILVHGYRLSRAGIGALGTMNAAVVVQDHLKLLFRFRNPDDINRLRGAIEDAEIAPIAEC